MDLFNRKKIKLLQQENKKLQDRVDFLELELEDITPNSMFFRHQ